MRQLLFPVSTTNVKKLLISGLSIFLLSAQWFGLNHETEHLYHEHEPTCDALIHFSASSAACHTGFMPFFPDFTSPDLSTGQSFTITGLSICLNAIRAPPVSLFA